MSVRVAALARLLVKNEANVRAQYQGPFLVWDHGPKPKEFDEFRPQKTHGLGDLSGSQLAEAAVLELKKGNAEARAFGSITLGRSVTNDLVVDHKTVSRMHATFQSANAAWTVADATSRYGTFVADRRLAEGERATLAHGTKLRFGDIEMTFCEAAPFFDALRKEIGLP